METQERFPQGLGNLAQNTRFPHSHKPIVVFVERRQNDRNSHSVTKPSTKPDQAQLPLPDPMRAIVSTFQKVSTKTDQAQNRRYSTGQFRRGPGDRSVHSAFQWHRKRPGLVRSLRCGVSADDAPFRMVAPGALDSIGSTGRRSPSDTRRCKCDKFARTVPGRRKRRRPRLDVA